jgi:adenine-specific DNA-methyltransferase
LREGVRGRGLLKMKKSQEQISFVRELRRKQTDAEKALWIKLRNKQLGGVKFRRQQPIGPYIVDFTSLERKLVIENNGGQHNEEKMREKDEERTRWLKERGYQVLRFWDNEVLMNMKGVLEKTMEALR